MAGANATYVTLARHLTPAQRFNVETGAYPLGRVARQATQRDYQADRVVRRYGPSRLQAAIDRDATPTPTAWARRHNGNGAHLPAGAAFER